VPWVRSATPRRCPCPCGLRTLWFLMLATSGRLCSGQSGRLVPVSGSLALVAGGVGGSAAGRSSRVGAIRTCRRQPYLLVGWCWFLGVLVPFIGVIQAGEQAMADRYMYIPILGLFLPAVWGLAALLTTLPHHRWWSAGASIWCWAPVWSARASNSDTGKTAKSFFGTRSKSPWATTMLTTAWAVLWTRLAGRRRPSLVMRNR